MSLLGPLNYLLSFVFVCSTISPPDLVPVVPPRDLLRPNPTRMTIAGVGGVDSNFLVQVCPCITSQMDSDLPAIMVFIEYLCALEVCMM